MDFELVTRAEDVLRKLFGRAKTYFESEINRAEGIFVKVEMPNQLLDGTKVYFFKAIIYCVSEC